MERRQSRCFACTGQTSRSWICVCRRPTESTRSRRFARWPTARIIVLTTYGRRCTSFARIQSGSFRISLEKHAANRADRYYPAGACRPSPHPSGNRGRDGRTRRGRCAHQPGTGKLRGVASGSSNKLIAEQLGISEHTVKGHLKSILSRTRRHRPHARSHDRAEARLPRHVKSPRDRSSTAWDPSLQVAIAIDERDAIGARIPLTKLQSFTTGGAGDIPSASSMTCLPKPAWIRSTRTCSRSVAARDKQHCRWLVVGAV